MTGAPSSVTVANRWRALSGDDGQMVGQRAVSAPRLSLPSGSADGFLCHRLWALPDRLEVWLLNTVRQHSKHWASRTSHMW